MLHCSKRASLLALLALATVGVTGCHRHTLVDVTCIPVDTVTLTADIKLNGVSNKNPAHWTPLDGFGSTTSVALIFDDGATGEVELTFTAKDGAQRETLSETVRFFPGKRMVTVAFPGCEGPLDGPALDLADLAVPLEDLVAPVDSEARQDLIPVDDLLLPDLRLPDLFTIPNCPGPPADLGKPNPDGWMQQTGASGNGVFGLNNGKIYIAADGAPGYVFVGDNTGAWQKSAAVNSSALYTVWAASPSDVYAGGVSGVFHSPNGLSGWSNVITSAQVSSIWGAGGTDVYAVTYNGGILHGTGPGSSTWAPQVNPVSSNGLRGVWGSSASDVYAVGDNGLILHTTNKGMTWTPNFQLQSDLAQIDLYGVWGSGACDVYVVGSRGSIYHSRGDDNWIKQPVLTTVAITGVWGSGPYDVWVAGNSDYVAHSRGDAKWDETPLSFGASWKGVGGFAKDVYVVDVNRLVHLRW